MNYVNDLSNTLINLTLYFLHLSFQKVKASFNEVDSGTLMRYIRNFFGNVIRMSSFMVRFNCDIFKLLLKQFYLTQIESHVTAYKACPKNPLAQHLLLLISFVLLNLKLELKH
jgi:hypothetical protein